MISLPRTHKFTRRIAKGAAQGATQLPKFLTSLLPRQFISSAPSEARRRRRVLSHSRRRRSEEAREAADDRLLTRRSRRRGCGRRRPGVEFEVARHVGVDLVRRRADAAGRAGVQSHRRDRHGHLGRGWILGFRATKFGRRRGGFSTTQILFRRDRAIPRKKEPNFPGKSCNFLSSGELSAGEGSG